MNLKPVFDPLSRVPQQGCHCLKHQGLALARLQVPWTRRRRRPPPPSSEEGLVVNWLRDLISYHGSASVIPAMI
jgi:predicted alpha/beta-hydrolase family hydrolase